MASFRFWRLCCTRMKHNSSIIVGCRDVRYQGVTFYLKDYRTFPPAMTGNTSPSPLVASQTDEWGGYPAFCAFDGSLSDYSRAITGGGLLPEKWLQLDGGTTQNLVGVSITTDSAGDNYHPVDFQVKGSHTGAFAGEEVVVLSIVGQTTWGPGVSKVFVWEDYTELLGLHLPSNLSQLLPSGVPPRTYSVPHGEYIDAAVQEALSPLAFGPGRIAGTLKIITVPASREVRLYDRHTGQLLRRTVSTPDGRYVFDRLALGRPYLVVGLDAVGVPMYNASVADMITLQESDIP